MPYVDDATEAAFIAADKESEKDIERFCKEQGISPASMAFAFGFRAGFRTAHPTWQAILAKRKAFACARDHPPGRSAQGRKGPDTMNLPRFRDPFKDLRPAAPPPAAPGAIGVKALAAQIVLAGKRRRGELACAMPEQPAPQVVADPVALSKAILLAGQRRRGEALDAPTPPQAAPGPITDPKTLAAKIIEAGVKARAKT
jgi:hypothetical protein